MQPYAGVVSVAYLIILNARIWAHPDEPISPPQTLTIRDGVISEEDPPPAAPVLDAAGKVVTAGFVNAHVHLTERDWVHAGRKPAVDLQSSLDDMFLSRGFTTVFDLSSNPFDTNALIRRIARGELRGPRILTSGTGIRPWRGLAFYIRETLPWYLRWSNPGPATRFGARTTVELQARMGAELTKLFTGSYVERDRIKPMRPAVARAAADAAHRRGMRVLAHPSNHEGTRVALDASVDALAHVPDETEGTYDLLRDAARRGTRVIPTLHMFESTVTTNETYNKPIRDALSTFIRAGGKVMFGTDVGYMPERDTLPEFVAMHKSGMTTADILRSLTVEPALFLGTPDAGQIKVGAAADLVVLGSTNSNPVPADLADITAVIRNGAVIWARP